MRLLSLLVLLVLIAGCARDEESVEQKYERTNAAIENRARAIEAQVENEVAAAEARLEAEADALLDAARGANEAEPDPAANPQ